MRLSSVAELTKGDVPRYVAGEKFVHFCVCPRLWGVVLWGRPGRQDALDLGRSLIRELSREASPHSSIIDTTGLTGADVGAFDELTGYVQGNFDRLAQAVTRLALVRPTGMEGALVAGIYQVMPRPYPVQIFEEVSAAMTWLIENDPTLAEHKDALPRALEEVVLECTGIPPVVRALRGYLEPNLGKANVSDAAHTLRLSQRTLQRRLSEANTTFHEELALARLGAAQRLMLDSDAALTAIAFEVGCASLQHFSALFRRRTGVSPSAWRSSRKKD